MLAVLSRRTLTSAYAEYQPQLVHLIQRQTHNRELAEELTQEVFIKADLAIRSGTRIQNIQAWLYSIARNTTIDFKRKRSLNSAADIDIECEIATQLDHPEKAFLKSEKRHRFIQLMKKLNPLQKEVLILRWLHDLSFEEISERLNLSLSSVKSLAYRGTQRLRLDLSGLSSALEPHSY